MTRRAFLALGAALLGQSGASAGAAPQTAPAYPSRPVTFVVGFPAGAVSDLTTRFLAERLARRLGQPVVVENRPGAGTTIGAKSVVTAEPDGYTLLWGTLSMIAIAPVLYKELDFDPKTLVYRWKHQDPRVDRLHEETNALVGARPSADRQRLFAEIHALAHTRAGVPAPDWVPRGKSALVPRLTEPWYCCAEPSPDQIGLV